MKWCRVTSETRPLETWQLTLLPSLGPLGPPRCKEASCGSLANRRVKGHLEGNEGTPARSQHQVPGM